MKISQILSVACLSMALTMSVASAKMISNPYFSIDAVNGWEQKSMPQAVPPGTSGTFIYSKSAGTMISIIVIPGNISAKDVAENVAGQYKKNGMTVSGPKKLEGSDAYLLETVSKNKRMKTDVYFAGNGKNLSQITLMGGKRDQAVEFLKTLKPKEENLFPKF